MSVKIPNPITTPGEDGPYSTRTGELYPQWLWPHLRDFYDMSEVELLARCLYGEASGESVKGKYAVACVIRNRVAGPSWWGTSLHQVILQNKQFSAFNMDSPRLTPMRRVPSQNAYNDCKRVASDVLLLAAPDITGGADHYHATSMQKYPSWAGKMKRTCQIEHHIFYLSKPLRAPKASKA